MSMEQTYCLLQYLESFQTERYVFEGQQMGCSCAFWEGSILEMKHNFENALY